MCSVRVRLTGSRARVCVCVDARYEAGYIHGYDLTLGPKVKHRDLKERFGTQVLISLQCAQY